MGKEYCSEFALDTNSSVYSDKRDTRLVSNIIEQEVPTSENDKIYIRDYSVHCPPGAAPYGVCT